MFTLLPDYRSYYSKNNYSRHIILLDFIYFLSIFDNLIQNFTSPGHWRSLYCNLLLIFSSKRCKFWKNTASDERQRSSLRRTNKTMTIAFRISRLKDLGETEAKGTELILKNFFVCWIGATAGPQALFLWMSTDISNWRIHLTLQVSTFEQP